MKYPVTSLPIIVSILVVEKTDILTYFHMEYVLEYLLHYLHYGVM